MTTAEWVEDQFRTMDLTGRDSLYTHLIEQEASFWYHNCLEGKPIINVDFLIRRRGFNADEKFKFRSLANFFVANAEKIREMGIHFKFETAWEPDPDKRAELIRRHVGGL